LITAKTSGVVEVSSLHRTEVFVSHRNARLTVHGRWLLVERVRTGRPVAHVAAEMDISRATAHKWMRRWRTEGELDRTTTQPAERPPQFVAARGRVRP
jgi:transposase